MIIAIVVHAWLAPFLVLLPISCYFANLVTVGVPFIPTSDDLRPFAAEMWLVVGIAANLLIPFVVRKPNFVCAGATLVALLIGTFSQIGLHGAGPHLAGMLLFDSTAAIWKMILLPFVAGVVLLWIGNSGRTLRQGDAPEFFVLLLGSTLGMCLMASTTHLLMIFMAIALASMPSYLLAGFRKASKRGAEASLKYVLFGAVTSAIMIYGITFLYGIYGTLQLTDLMDRAPVTGATAALSLALLGLLIGIGFKSPRCRFISGARMCLKGRRLKSPPFFQWPARERR